MTAPIGWQLPAQHPLLLLPVRLETRFVNDSLKIRVIPDSLHIDTFETGLTNDERSAGQWYWAQAAADAAWDQLADHFSPQRAAWIARVTRAGSGSPSRTATWSTAPAATLLPTRWQAVARTQDEIVRATGNPIPPGPLTAGIDPATPAAGLPAWMTDFDVAVALGMGLELPLGEVMLAQQRVDLLIVYGVDETADTTNSADRITALLTAHYYTDGLMYLAPGTPTNNTAQSQSGYHPASAQYRRSYQVQPTDPVATGVDTAAARLAAALSLSTASTAVGGVPTAPVITLADGAGLADEPVARAMNDALWAGTWGYFLSQMLVADDGEEGKRLDHLNVIADDAYLRSLDRRRLWPNAQRLVIFSNTGIDPGEPGTPGFGAAWQAMIDRLVQDQHLSEQQAIATLSGQVDAELVTLWRQEHGDSGTPLDDWLAARAALEQDRTARFAYFRWLDRTVSSGHAGGDTRLSDWLAGQSAARYGPATVRAAREHWRLYVRPGGHLPTLAIGRQPYGVLIATSLDSWQPDTTEQGLVPLVHALRALRDTVWLPAASGMPRLGVAEVDVDTANSNLLDVMGGAPVSAELFARIHLGPDYLRNLWRFAQPGLRPDWEAVTASVSKQILYEAGVAWSPRVARVVAAEQSSAINDPLITAEDLPTADWLAFFADPAATIDQLTSRPDLGGSGPTPLLYRLLRHSALREYADAAIDLLAGQGLLGDWQHLDRELIGIRPGTPGTTVWSTIHTQNVSTPTGPMSVAAVLESGTAGPFVAGLDQFRDAVAGLAGTDDATLERHLRQTLDTTSHRLDAWIGSIAARRLQNQHSSGVLLGGYAWVTDLRPAGVSNVDVGYVHAPSVGQAVTSAVLRAGYDANSGGANNPFAINLASDRARMAHEFLGAVRTGLSPGAALGYLFERRVQRSSAGQYLPRLRSIASTAANVLDPETSVVTSTTVLSGVVDGLHLAHKLATGDPELRALLAGIANDDTNLPAGAEPLLPVINAALGELAEIVDATSDALLAESVHQVANGSPARSAATLDALAHAEGSVPELDVLRTPRRGTALTHRIAVLIAADAAGRPNWPDHAATVPDPRASPRAAASPQLDILLQTLLPDPAAVTITATVAADVPVSTVISLADAGLSALDCVLGTPAAADPAQETVPELLSAALSVAARAKVGRGDQFIPVQLDLATPAGATGPGLGDVIEIFRLVGDVVRRSRPLSDIDLAPTGSSSLGDPALGRGVATAAAAALDATLDQLTSADPAIQRAGLRAGARLGSAGAAAASEAPTIDPAVVASAVKDLSARQVAVLALADDDPVGRIHAALGADLPVLGSVAPLDVGDIGTAVAAATEAFAPTRAVRGWLCAAATVRAPAAAVQRTVAGQAAIRLSQPAPRTIQLPAVVDDDGRSTEPWVGRPFGGRTLAGPRTQVTYIAPPDIELTTELAGLLVDEWSETVPDRTATTAVAFRYPTPSNQPPQSLLLAVNPDTTRPWDASALESVLQETLDLAAVRAVDPDALASGRQPATTYSGQLFPAAYFAYNPSANPPDTVSTQFIPPPQAPPG